MIRKRKGLGLAVAVALTVGLGVGLGGVSTPRALAQSGQIHLTPQSVQAIERRDAELLQRQLMQGADPNTKLANGTPLIVLAGRQGFLRAVDLLLEHRARVDEADRGGNTALMWAAELGHVEIIERLLQAGAHINRPNRDGLTPLIRAVQQGQTRAVEVLLSRGADPNITDYTGRSPMLWAKESRSRAIERLLREAGGID